MKSRSVCVCAGVKEGRRSLAERLFHWEARFLEPHDRQPRAPDLHGAPRKDLEEPESAMVKAGQTVYRGNSRGGGP